MFVTTEFVVVVTVILQVLVPSTAAKAAHHRNEKQDAHCNSLLSRIKWQRRKESELSGLCPGYLVFTISNNPT
ncbi:hypothetical protein PC121_g8639 [Phytophthora cactorum]|nr:hypothetical protein PC120_g24370 [Phytophthora cactorum]KAG3073503.1 hypothetical protein PC121_g8639 [Phytophthora cactorum]KAG4048184.1 hypothetical protein PC123_g16493 [Phytophthora cactorum]